MGFFDIPTPWDIGKKVAGKAVSTVGTVAHLPEMGYSESLSGNAESANSRGVSTVAPEWNGQISNASLASKGYIDDQGQISNPQSTYQDQTYQAPVDPYAQWGGQTNYNNLLNQFMTQKQGIFDSANAAGDVTSSQYGRSILDFLDQNRVGQQQIDRRAQNNELAKMQGVQGIMGMVGRGIRSGGVMLNNKNAGDSSAAGAIANAYGQIGRGEMANVGNQYELGNQEVQDAQDQFAVQQASGVRNLQGTKEENVNNIVNEARNAFASLDARMGEASLPERIAIEQEKESIKQQILAKLQGLDQQLTSGLSGITASSADTRREEASRLARAGTSLGQDAFNFSTEAPSTFQGPSPSGGQFPLFTLNRRREA